MIRNSPIFIIGNPRSGTTLLRLMLTCHHSIMIPPECGFTVWLHDRYKKWRWDSVSFIEAFSSDLYRCKKFDTWRLEKDSLSSFVFARQPDTYRDLVSCVYEFYGTTLGRPFTRWGDKNNFYIQHILTIKEIFPDAVIIHIVRDGRDVACSYKDLGRRAYAGPYAPTLPGAVTDIAREWSHNIAHILAARALITPEMFLEVRFEDLILHTEVVLTSLCAQLGEDFDRSMLEFYRENRAKELEPRETLPWKTKTLSPPRPEVIGRYKKEMPSNDIRLFEHIAGVYLREYSYL